MNVLLSYLLIFVVFLLDECFANRSTFPGCIFSFEDVLRFMSTTKNTKNVTTFLCFFVVLPYLTTLMDECFALKFMNIMKNTSKVTNFLLLCNFCSSTIFKHFSLYFFSVG